MKSSQRMPFKQSRRRGQIGLGLCLSIVLTTGSLELAGYGVELEQFLGTGLEHVNASATAALDGLSATGDEVLDIFCDRERCLRALSGHSLPQSLNGGR